MVLGAAEVLDSLDNAVVLAFGFGKLDSDPLARRKLSGPNVTNHTLSRRSFRNGANDRLKTRHGMDWRVTKCAKASESSLEEMFRPASSRFTVHQSSALHRGEINNMLGISYAKKC